MNHFRHEGKKNTGRFFFFPNSQTNTQFFEPEDESGNEWNSRAHTAHAQPTATEKHLFVLNKRALQDWGGLYNTKENTLGELLRSVTKYSDHQQREDF